MENNYHSNGNENKTKNKQTKTSEKKAGVTILILDKTDFKTKTVTRDKEGYYLTIKGTKAGRL